MNQKVAAVRAEHWRQTIYECLNRDPKLSKKQWCRENGVYYRSLMYWQRRFQMEALDLMENHDAALPVKQDSFSAPAFADMAPQLKALQAEQEPVPDEFHSQRHACFFGSRCDGFQGAKRVLICVLIIQPG